jgi:hypothetical protein
LLPRLGLLPFEPTKAIANYFIAPPTLETFYFGSILNWALMDFRLGNFSERRQKIEIAAFVGLPDMR